MVDEELLRSAALDLYAAPPAAFIAARNERGKVLRGDGHSDVAKLVAAFKKPSAGADAVNRLVRQDDELVQAVIELGARLRSAQADPVAGELRALDQERRALVARARAAAERDDDSATAATLDHVEQTVWAAVVDATAAAVVLAGALVRPLSPGGFGEVDVEGASAVPVDAVREEVVRPERSKPRPTAAKKGRSADHAEVERARKEAERARREAEDALAEAQDAARVAQQELETATAAAEQAVERRDDLEEERDDLRSRLTAVEKALRESKGQVSETSAAVRDAEQRRRTTAAAVDRAVQRLDQA